MIANIIVTVLFVIVAIALIVVGIMAATGKLKGNSYIGLRINEVRKNESTWMQAHKVAGPFWLFAGVALAFGAAFAWIASGWLWLIPVIALVIAVAIMSVGGNFGARAAAVVDQAIKAQENQPEAPAPAPKLDFDAVRRAASQSDQSDQSDQSNQNKQNPEK